MVWNLFEYWCLEFICYLEFVLDSIIKEAGMQVAVGQEGIVSRKPSA